MKLTSRIILHPWAHTLILNTCVLKLISSSRASWKRHFALSEDPHQSPWYRSNHERRDWTVVEGEKGGGKVLESWRNRSQVMANICNSPRWRHQTTMIYAKELPWRPVGWLLRFSTVKAISIWLSRVRVITPEDYHPSVAEMY